MTIPNILSIFRIMLIPVFIVVFFGDFANAYEWAAFVFVLAGATDLLDGYIARKYNQITMLGRILDPLADKLMVFSALVCLTIKGIVPLWLTLIFFTKEAIQMVGGLVLFRKIHDMPPANKLGKAATFFFNIAIAVSILGTGLSPIYRNLPLAAALLLMFLAFGSYLCGGIGLIGKAKQK